LKCAASARCASAMGSRLTPVLGMTSDLHLQISTFDIYSSIS
jgi:hypothetical protein